MGYPFGQDFTYSFYPLVDNDAALLIPSQSPAIYVFTDSNVPTRTTAAAGTGATQTITTWTQRGLGFDFTVTALTDPDTTSTLDRRTYWLGINFILKTAGQTQTLIRALEMERVSGHHKQISVTTTDILNYFPEATAYVSEQTILAFIANAKEEIKARLTNNKFEWAQIWRPDRLNISTIYKTLMSIGSSQRKIVGDNFDRNYEEWKLIFESTINSIKLEYDTFREGQPTAKPPIGGFAFLSR